MIAVNNMRKETTLEAVVRRAKEMIAQYEGRTDVTGRQIFDQACDNYARGMNLIARGANTE